MSENNQKELVLSPNQYAYIRDLNKGTVNTWCGPHKDTLSNTDELVIFDNVTKKFVPAPNLESAKQLYVTAPENWYVILKNPAKDNKHPSQSDTTADLNIGRKVNILGSCNFALFPGQMAKVIQGHRLRSNQYLLVRVYDVDSAKLNWNPVITKLENDKKVNKTPVATPAPTAYDFVVGETFIIKGIDVSFYIPPTGIEVIPDNCGNYVRNAVTLERLEYCILKDESGNKKYTRGPSVVFPTPTEQFVEDKDNNLKYRAYELNENSGIYIKVIADYEEDKKVYKTGEELFITGKDDGTKIYFPRAEHAIIAYNGNQVINYAIAVPEGEGRYVLNKNTGEVQMVVGPHMFLPDPRTQVVVKRVLTDRQCDLWYPDNVKVKNYNRNLRQEQETSISGYVTADSIFTGTDMNKLSYSGFTPSNNTALRSMSAGAVFKTADISRSNEFTKPRTITLQGSEYDGVVSLDIWSGYAVKVVSKSGESKIINGPQTYLLGYNETLEQLSLSTSSSNGSKNTDNLLPTIYLKTKNNKVKDVIRVETKDFCEIDVKLIYNVNFDGKTQEEMNKWFDDSNYVKTLCDRMKSRIRRTIKKLTLGEFFTNASDIIDSVVLGQDKQSVKFTENNMEITDLEVIGAFLVDPKIKTLFEENQHLIIKKQIQLEQAEVQSSISKQLSEIEKEDANIIFDLKSEKIKLEQSIIEREKELENLKFEKEKKAKIDQNTITSLKIESDKSLTEARLLEKERLNELDIKMIEANTNSIKDRMTAISPKLIESLQALSNIGMTTEIAKSIAPYLLTGSNESISDVVRKLTINNSTIEDIVKLFKE